MSSVTKRMFEADDTLEPSKRHYPESRGSLLSRLVSSDPISPRLLRGPRAYEQDFSKPGDRLRGLERRFYVRQSSADPTTTAGSQESGDESKASDINGFEEEPMEAGQKIICFGMIHKARVKLLETATISRQFLGEPVPETSLYKFKLFFQTNYFLRLMHSSEGIAVLNEETSKVLAATRLPSFRIEAYSEIEAWDNLLVNKEEFDTKTILFIDIVLYGSEAIRDEVGRILSSARVYLEHPSYKVPPAEYDNPHFLDFRDSILASAITASIPSGASPLIPEDFPPVEAAFAGEQKSSRAQVRRRVAEVLDSLTRSENLKRIDADIRIVTPLLPHQEQALDFMAQREFGPVPEAYSLWASSNGKKHSYFQHLITGDRIESVPNETGGGILADDMGLGKTLSVISTIIRTASAAQLFASGVGNKRRASGDVSKDVPRVQSRSTLVLVLSPLLLDGWLGEIESHCDGSLETKRYHGRGREVDAGTLANSDLVLSTYHTVAAEALDASSPLNQIAWFRIVLDEGSFFFDTAYQAHIIRRMSTKLCRAVSTLSGRHRWCLTGTPVQNTLEDLASLVAFVRSYPLDDLLSFRKHIVAPLMKGTDQGSENLRLLLDSICLRRTKKLLDLPTTSFEDRLVEFSAAELSEYRDVEKEGIKMIKQHCSEARNMKGYFGFFQLHIQLRRLCNHGSHQRPIAGVGWPEDPEVAFEVLQQKDCSECVYCKATVTGLNRLQDCFSGRVTPCGYLFCFECLPRYRQELSKYNSIGRGSLVRCSLCPQMLPASYLSNQGESSSAVNSSLVSTGSYFRPSGVSSKVLALVKDMKRTKAEWKSIVFSSWTKSLDLVGQYFTHNNIPFKRIDGTYTLSQRQKVLEAFDTDECVQILLMTTGTGAVGLNLTIANCVYILEPQWNPMVENQAIGRVLRLGQEQEVKVVRYIMKGSVEEGMKHQQSRKLDLAKLGWERKVEDSNEFLEHHIM